MGFLGKILRSNSNDGPEAEEQVGFNPNRDDCLFWYTEEGYIIAQDVTCQHEYIQDTACPTCGGELVVIAHLNRGGQGLSELVAICRDCKARTNFIFDISNDVYQEWWAEQLGPLYVRQYDGPPREPFSQDAPVLDMDADSVDEDPVEADPVEADSVGEDRTTDPRAEE
ncbi:MAG: hypothetical protein GYB65_15815 [Chloroflexi bacterium]|nr:hypothetical protein [Chloroflexota bacterium]